MSTRVHLMPHGARWRPEQGTAFRLWAPGQEHVGLKVGEREAVAMRAGEEGWHELTLDWARPGMTYSFVLPDGTTVPDPASRFQPDDIHGPSAIVDPAGYQWNDDGWQGRPWTEIVLYELHIGTFTPEGTFRAAIGRLDHLAKLGVTAIEIMPVGDFPGRWNWGYDGVLLYAPDSRYGRPEDLKALVDAAHGKGIAVILDVIYNHFGPDGNYIPLYAPPFFTDRHKTPWGPAVNYDGTHSRAVRDFAIHNALYWLGEFHLDGLRLDAVHAIKDDSEVDLLREIVETVRAHVTDRPIHLILENEDNVVSRLERQDSTARRYTAQLNDDVHHVLHVAVTGEHQGYYEDYRGDTDRLGRALAEGFAFQGEAMPYSGRARGEPSAALPPSAFVAFLQNHDQIGNRAFGDRIGTIAEPEAVRAAMSVGLLLPQIPMLFMGEEWGTAKPFPFFSDFSGDLADAVRKGRREEFARFPAFSDPETRDTIPDPQNEATFRSAVLDWNEAEHGDGRDRLDWVRRILSARRESIVPLLPGIKAGGVARTVGDSAVEIDWQAADGSVLNLAANLKGEKQGGFTVPDGKTVWTEGKARKTDLGPWSVRWTIVSKAQS